jgi:HNH endonuclease
MNQIQEEWRIVPEDPKYMDPPIFNGMFMASNLGNIKKLNPKTNQWEICNQFNSEKFYKLVTIKKGCTRRVHRMVALAFLDNPLNKCSVNHIDTDKANNHLSNLEWSTMQENSSHAVKHNCRPKQCPNPVFKGKRNQYGSELEYLIAYLNFHSKVVAYIKGGMKHGELLKTTQMCERTIRCIKRRLEKVEMLTL